VTKATVQRQGDVAELVIAAPPLNLFDATMVDEVEDALAVISALARSGDVRAMILRAEGKVFCAGVDVHEFIGLSTSRGAALMARFLTLAQGIEALPVPTVAVVHGLDLTIGFELSLGCDLLWAAESASFGLVEPMVGLTPGGGGTQRMVARAGVARAAEFVMTGDIYGAEELRSWGVVNRIRPDEALLEDAREYAARLAAGPTSATAIAKRLLLTARDHGVAAADAVTPTACGPVFASADAKDGLISLLENGPGKAAFHGR